MTWSEFKTAVRVYLPAHSRRQGIQTLIDQLVLGGVRDLQSAIPTIRFNRRTVYEASRFTADGFCGRAYFPRGAHIKALYARNPDDHSQMFEYRTAVDETERAAMVEGKTTKGTRWAIIDAVAGTVRVAPSPVDDGSDVVIVYDAEKTDYEEDDDVPFDDNVVAAVADFVLARLSRMVDGDIPLAESYNSTYVAAKRLLYSNATAAAKTPARAK